MIEIGEILLELIRDLIAYGCTYELLTDPEYSLIHFPLFLFMMYSILTITQIDTFSMFIILTV